MKCMKILYIATSFPKPDKGATIYTDLAEALFHEGHEVTVAVSEQSKNLKKSQLTKERGFDVLRIVTGNYYDVSFVEKGITSFKIPILMKKGIAKYLGNKKFDFILYESQPITNATLVQWAKKHFGCPSYLMLKDLFPQNAVDLGIIKKNSAIHKVFKSKEIKLYKSADYIGCTSLATKDYLREYFSWIDQEKVEIFPNTKKITNNFINDGFEMREKLGIPRETCVFLFGGNMGKPQYIDLLVEAVKRYKKDDTIYFLFVGRGTDRYKLENIIEKESITNAKVIENLAREQYEQVLKESDVGLIILDPKFTIPNYPSRILSYMEYAKPVIAATDTNTDYKELIEEAHCGKWVWSGNQDAFIKEIKAMADCSSLKEIGLKGREYITKNLSIQLSVKLLENHFS